MRDQKIVLITGGTSGIGLQACKVFAKNGWEVHATGSSMDSVQNILLEIEKTKNLFFYPVDARNTGEIEELFRELPPLDVLINNIGIYSKTSWAQIPDPVFFDEIFAINVRSMWMFSTLYIRSLLQSEKKGLILNNASTLGKKPSPGAGLYSATKAAMLSLSQSIAMEHAPQIRSLSLLPGVVDTPIHAKNTTPEQKELFLSQMANFHPLKRVGTPQEIADILYLLSTDTFSWMSGSEIVIDGGISLVC